MDARSFSARFQTQGTGEIVAVRFACLSDR
jgi:hypothetical protein